MSVADRFEDLGIGGVLVDAAKSAGYDRPTRIQGASVPVLRRGGSAVLTAAPGSGATTGVLLALWDRLGGAAAGDGGGDAGEGGDGGEARTGPRALVLAATEARAQALARAAARWAPPAGGRAAALTGGWESAGAEVLAATPAGVVAAVGRSALKLENVQAVVIEGAALHFALGGGAALETMMPTLPREAQRIIITATLTPEVERFAEAHLRRAMHVPARLADPEYEAPATVHPSGTLSYVVASAAEMVDALARVLRERPGRSRAVVTRSAAAAAEVREALAARGFEAGVDVVASGERPDADAVIGYGVPLDADAFGAFLSGDTFVIRAQELGHLRQLATVVGLELQAGAAPPPADGGLEAYRASVRQALETEDIAAQLLVLEPLFDVRSPAEVAAALSALLRRRGGEAAPGSGVQAAGAGSTAAGAGSTPRSRPAVETASSAAFVRLFVSSGSRDGVKAGDLVGVIAGETGLPGSEVGKIEVRDTFSVVEVPAGSADRIIGVLNGTTFKGRALRVDFDRRSAPTTGGGARPAPGGPRGGRPSSGPGGAPRGPGGPRPTGGRSPSGGTRRPRES
jgi:ATP-dependent RNA helicase DeaD